MSKKVKTVSMNEFEQHYPIPVIQPKVKTGNGNATFKTATAAAKAAMEARDEAREHREFSYNNRLDAVRQLNQCEKVKDDMQTMLRMATWGLVAFFGLNIITSVLLAVLL